MLFPGVEVTRLLSNLIKSFVAFSKEDALVIDANKNHIIENINASLEQKAAEQTAEEALAAEMIRDVGLDGDSEHVEGSFSGEFQNLSEEDVAQQTEELLRMAKLEAEEIVNQAHQEVEQMRIAAYDETEEIKQQAKEEGYQAGYSEGGSQIIAEYEEKKAQLEAQIAENEQLLLEKERTLVEDTERQMVEWLCRMLPEITGVFVEKERDVLLYMVNKAMRDLDNSKKFVIRVSGADYGMLAERKDEIYGALNPGIEVEIFEDAKLNAMQCVIDTDNGMVDLSLDVQLDNLIKALKLMIQK